MKAHSDNNSNNSNRASDKRERILAAAERIFAQSGFYNARVAEIARAAGVADGTIYLYFKSKDDLLISLFESRMERVNAELTAAAGQAESPEQKLCAVVQRHLAMVRENPNVAEVLTIELRQSSKFMKEYSNPRFGEFLKLIAGIVAEGQECGHFDRSIPPAHVARMVFGILDELALAWLLGGGENFDIVRAADWVGALVMNGLQSRTQSTSLTTPETPAEGAITEPEVKQE